MGEEIANSITSGIASGLSVAALIVMVVYAALRGDGWCVTACAIIRASLILSNLSFTLYKRWRRGSRSAAGRCGRWR